MDNIQRRSAEYISEHNDTVHSMFFFKMEELRDEVAGGYLEFANEFIVREGSAIEPHSHNSDEFYFVLEGSGTMTIDGESALFSQGELVRIRPHQIHSLAADRGGDIRCFCFAISYMPEDEVGFTAYPVDGGEPHFVSTRYWD